MWLTVKLSMRQHRAKIGELMWKIVDGYDGYEVNEFGTIRSRHTCKVKSERRSSTSNRPYVNLWKNGVGKNVSVGRVVAKAFCSGYRDGFLCDAWRNYGRGDTAIHTSYGKSGTASQMGFRIYTESGTIRDTRRNSAGGFRIQKKRHWIGRYCS